MGRESLERLRASRGLRGAIAAGRQHKPVLLVCAKCERRMLERGRFRQAGQLREALATCAAEGSGLRVLQVECLDVCPEGGVAVCLGEQTGRPAETFVVRTVEDVQMAFEQRQSELVSKP